MMMAKTILSLFLAVLLSAHVSNTYADPLPNLTVIDVDVLQDVQVGGPVNLYVAVQNNGEAVAPGLLGGNANGFMIDVVLSDDFDAPVRGALFSEEFADDVLLRGGRETATNDLDRLDLFQMRDTTARIPEDTPTGLKFICVIADPLNRVAESDESDNVGCTPVTITKEDVGPMPPADLEVTLQSVAFVCEDGETRPRLNYTTRNLGPGWAEMDADGVSMKTSLGEPPLDRGWRNSSSYIGLSQPGQVTRHENAGIPLRDIEGEDITLVIHADPDNALDEPDENNNHLEINFRVPDLPCR